VRVVISTGPARCIMTACTEGGYSHRANAVTRCLRRHLCLCEEGSLSRIQLTSHEKERHSGRPLNGCNSAHDVSLSIKPQGVMALKDRTTSFSRAWAARGSCFFPASSGRSAPRRAPIS
jgi:hypothetical protein